MNIYLELTKNMDRNSEDFAGISAAFTRIYKTFTDLSLLGIKAYLEGRVPSADVPNEAVSAIESVRAINPEKFDELIKETDSAGIIALLSEDAFINREKRKEYSFDKDNAHIKEHLEEFEEKIHRVSENDIRADRIWNSLYSRALTGMNDYMTYVLDMNNFLALKGHCREYEEYDHARSKIHNALIKSLPPVNRQCENYGMSEIFPLSPDEGDNRQIAANYAYYVCQEMFFLTVG